MWRHGRLLVVRKGDEFPDRCIKTNEPADGLFLKQELEWTPIWALLPQLLLGHWGSLARPFTTRKVEIHVGVSRRIRQRRRRRFFIAGLICVAGVVAAFLGINAMQHQALGSFMLLIGGIFAMLGGMVYYLNASQIVSAKRILDEYVWIKGVHRDFLAELPEWRPEPADP